MRTSCVTYSNSPDDINNQFVHLTNNAIQKNAQDYGHFEDGNQISFVQFEEYVKENIL